MPRVYLDHHATTPLDGRVLDAMMPFLTDHFGNPASQHSWGNNAYEAVGRARQQVADLLGAKHSEIIFTSGSSESNRLVLGAQIWDRLTISTIEHPSVENLYQGARTSGGKILHASFGRIYPGQLLDKEMVQSILEDASEHHLFSVMLANNETGQINDIHGLSSQCHQLGVYLHTDATQGLGYLPLDVSRMPGLHFASISGHKIYGPKGVGALFVREGMAELLSPVEHVTELGLRAGTLNVPGIVGLGEACRIMSEQGEEEADQLAPLRDRLFLLLTEGLGAHRVIRNGASIDRASTLPQTLNVWLSGVSSERLTMGLWDIALSTGSACSVGEPSRVLQQLYPGQTSRWEQSIRMAVGRFTTVEEVEHAAARILEEVRQIETVTVTVEDQDRPVIH